MKRLNFLSFSKHKNTSELIKEMESIEIEHQRSKLKKLLTERKNKLKELMTHKQINQPKINYLRKNGNHFSFVESNASKEPFVPEKIKRRKIDSNRVYSSSPNMKVGMGNSGDNKQQIDDKIIKSKKFLEFDRIIDTQSGLRKIQALQKLHESKKNKVLGNKNVDLKKTFFQKLVLDKYNFYSANDYKSIRSTMLANSKTQNQMKSQIHELSKLKSASTLDSSIRQREYSSLQNSSLRRSRLDNKKFSAYQKSKCQINARSRIKTLGSQVLPISFQKNLDYINN